MGLRKAIAFAEENADKGLVFHKLDKESLRMVVFSDSSFANTYDRTTQLGHKILMTNKTGKSNVMNFASYKSKWIVRSVLAGETFDFADAFDSRYALKFDIEQMTGWNITINMLIETMSLFRVIVSSSKQGESG